MSQFRLRTNPHNSPLQRPPVPQSLSSLISLPSSTKKGSISREIGFPLKTFESVKDIMSKDDILFSRRENSSPQKSSSRGGGGKSHLNIPSKTSENMKFSRRSSISTPKYNNVSTRAGTLTSIASSTKIKNLQHPQSIQSLSSKMSNKARFSPFEMSTTKSSNAMSLMEIENRKIILKLDSASIEGDIATEREEFLRKFARGSPKRSISPSVERDGDSDTSSEPNLTERIRKVREDSLVYKSGDEEEEIMPQLSKKEPEGKSRREPETTCRLQHNERSCRCSRHTASVEQTLKQMRIESKPKPASNITLLIKKRRTSTTKNSKGTKHIGFSHQAKSILQLESQLFSPEPILTPKAEEKPKIFISLNEINQETPIERSPQVATSSLTELGIKGVFSRRLDGIKNPRIQTDITEDAPTTISVVTPKHKTETEDRKEDEDSAYKMSLLKRMKSEPQHRNIHTLEITEEMDEISIRKTTQEDKNLNNFSTTSIIKSRLNLTEESDQEVTTTVKNNNKGAGARSSLNFKGLVELRRKEDLQEWVKLRRKTNKLDNDEKEGWNGNIKVIEEIRRRNIWEETPKAKENEETGFEIFKQGPGNFFEWNTENRFVQKHNILGNLQENIMATRQKTRAELNNTNETIHVDHNSSKELRVPQRNTEKDPSPMMVRYYDELNPLTIQPKFMESTGSMCVTELWGNKTKTSYYKHMRKPLQNSTLLSLTPGAGVYRPEKGLDSQTLKNKRILNGAIVQTENELFTSIESPHCFDSKKAYPTSKKARHTRAFVLQPSEKARNNHPFRNITSKLGL